MQNNEDVVRTNWPLGGTGNGLSLFGWITMYDNHDNSTRGNILNCADGQSYELAYDQLVEMRLPIDRYAYLATFRTDGQIPLGELESPLLTMCNKLSADAHNSPEVEADSPQR